MARAVGRDVGVDVGSKRGNGLVLEGAEPTWKCGWETVGFEEVGELLLRQIGCVDEEGEVETRACKGQERCIQKGVLWVKPDTNVFGQNQRGMCLSKQHTKLASVD